MEFDTLKMDEDTRKALHIASVSESDLTIAGNFKTVEMMKYDDGYVEIDMNDNGERVTYIFDKKQIEFIVKWLTHYR